jgi:hypothetical protein
MSHAETNIATSNPSNAIQTNGGPAAAQSFLFSINLIDMNGQCGVQWDMDPNFPLDQLWYRVYPDSNSIIGTTGPLSMATHKGQSSVALPQEYGPGAMATLLMVVYTDKGVRSEVTLLETPVVR